MFFDPLAYPEEATSLAILPELAGTAVFGIDLASPSEAVPALISARRAGLACAVLPILSDPFEHTLSLIGQSIAATADPDVQMDQFIALRIDQLLVNGSKPIELAHISEAEKNASALVLKLADLVLLGAPGERDRWTQLHARLFSRFEVLPTPAVESAHIQNESGLSIYAPSVPRNALSHYITLMRHRNIEPRIVCADNPNDRVETRVVLVPEWRSLRVRTLASAGHIVVTPNRFRVDECDSRILGYSAADYRSLLGAIDSAFATNGGSVRIHASVDVLREALTRELPPLEDGPRISIVVRTFDRPALLERAIASIAQQTYGNVEIVVVNNGGPDVRDIVERASNGRPFLYESMPARKTISAASNVGARAATGQYIGYLDDDDLLYADHCARTIDVLERTKADLAFTMCVAEYAEMRGDEKRVLGYQIYLDREYHPDDIYTSNVSPIHSIVHGRKLFEKFGYFDEELPVTDDWELWLRVAAGGGRFVRIDRATCEYSWRYDPERGNMTIEHQWDFVHAYEKITQRYAHVITRRAAIYVQQRNMLETQRQRAVAAADQANRASIIMSTMGAAMVPVAGDWQSRSA